MFVVCWEICLVEARRAENLEVWTSTLILNKVVWTVGNVWNINFRRKTSSRQFAITVARAAMLKRYNKSLLSISLYNRLQYYFRPCLASWIHQTTLVRKHIFLSHSGGTVREGLNREMVNWWRGGPVSKSWSHSPSLRSMLNDRDRKRIYLSKCSGLIDPIIWTMSTTLKKPKNFYLFLVPTAIYEYFNHFTVTCNSGLQWN